MGVGAVRTCNRVVTLPTSVGAVRSLRTCKRGGDFAHWRRCRSDMQAGGGRYEPGDGATTGRSLATAPPGREEPGDGGDGDAGSVGARRRSRHLSRPCDGAATFRSPRRAGRSPATAPQGREGPGDEGDSDAGWVGPGPAIKPGVCGNYLGRD